MNRQLMLIGAVLLGSSMLPVWAETEPMPEMDHSTMSGMDHSKMQGMDQNSTEASSKDTDTKSMSSGAMQGGSAPADARDPHAYSGGYSIESGKYALPGPRILKLADEHNFASLLVDRLETVRTSDNNSTVYDLQAWYGRDYDRAVLKAEGDVESGKLEEASTELLWGHALTAYWNTLLGIRYDNGEGSDQSWLAFGFQGLAPYWFEVDLTAYVGEGGRSALSIEAEYEMLLTQKLILQPRIEAEVFGILW